jgi:hypothetical protein
MKKAGDLLASFFDEQFLKTAQVYSDLFDSWLSIAGERFAAHSRVIEMKRDVLLVEADHPGWIQLLQTRERELLSAVRRRFPSLSVSGISFRLSRPPEQVPGRPRPVPASAVRDPPYAAVADARREPEASVAAGAGEIPAPYGNVRDERFRAALKRLEKSIRQDGASKRP